LQIGVIVSTFLFLTVNIWQWHRV